MKTLLLHFSILFSLSLVHSQTMFNRAYQSTSEIAAPFAIAMNGCYYSIGIGNDQLSLAKNFIYKHSANGSLFSKNQIFPNKQLKIHSVLKTNDKGLLILAEDFQCDGFSYNWTFYTYLIKLDSNSQEVFNKNINRSFQFFLPGADTPVLFSDSYKYGYQNNDSTYSVFSDSVLSKFSANGQLLSTKSLKMDSITSVLSLTNNLTLVSADTSGDRILALINAAGNRISSVGFPIALKKMAIYSGSQMIGLGLDGKLYKFDTHYNLIANTNNSSKQHTDFVYENDSIYSSLIIPGDSSAYSVMDTSFNTLIYSPVSTRSLNPIAICKSGSVIGLVSTSLADNENERGRNKFSSISVFNKTTGPIYASDIALGAVVTDTSYTVKIDSASYYDKYKLNIRIRFKVKNTGNSVINSFNLSSGISLYQVPACSGITYHQQTYSGLSLLPGDSIVLQSSIIQKEITIYPNTNFENSIPHKNCIFLTLPNGEVDAHQEDNEKCVIEIWSGLGINSISTYPPYVSVFPNPFNSEFTIESDTKISSVSIYNALGQAIKTQEASDKKVTLNNSDLQNGLYFLHIETEKGMVIKKVLKN